MHEPVLRRIEQKIYGEHASSAPFNSDAGHGL